jgi:hypothetical protein
LISYILLEMEEGVVLSAGLAGENERGRGGHQRGKRLIRAPRR